MTEVANKTSQNSPSCPGNSLSVPASNSVVLNNDDCSKIKRMECFLGWITSFVTVTLLYYLQIPIPYHSEPASIATSQLDKNLASLCGKYHADFHLDDNWDEGVDKDDDKHSGESKYCDFPMDEPEENRDTGSNSESNEASEPPQRSESEYPCTQETTDNSTHGLGHLSFESVDEEWNAVPLSPSSLSSSSQSSRESNLVQPEEDNLESHESIANFLPNSIDNADGVTTTVQTGSTAHVPSTSHIKSEDDTASSGAEPCRRSLRQIFKCGECHATFTNSARLELHAAECRDSRMDITDEEDDGISDNGMEVDWDEKDVFMTSEPEQQSDSCSMPDTRATETKEKIEVEKKHVIPPITKVPWPKKKSICYKCKAEVKRMFLLRHDDYLHSNGRFQFATDRVKGFTIQNCKLENFPSDTRRHPCPSDNCSKVFSLPQELEANSKLYHTQGKFNCHICDLTLATAIDVIDHELEHSDKKKQLENKDFKPGEQFFCGRCDAVTGRKAIFVNHYLECHLDMSTINSTCPICKQVFPHADRVHLVHYINFHDLSRLDDPTKPFRCADSNCSAYFLTEEQLHFHWNTAHQVNPSYRNMKKITGYGFSCSRCNKMCHSRTQLEFHVWRLHKYPEPAHHGKLVISSPEEGITVDDLLCDSKSKKFVCPERNCEEGFATRLNLKIHSKLHGKFSCNFCDAVTDYVPNLALHEMVHKVGLPEEDGKRGFFSCMRCSFSARGKVAYVTHHVETHLKLRTTEKKRCPICKLVYTGNSTNQSLLKTEVINHFIQFHDVTTEGSDGKPGEVHKCSSGKCAAYFRTSSQLQRHIWDIHLNISKEKRNQCSDCEFKCDGGRDLRKHRVEVHKLDEKDFQFGCTFKDCGKRFERQFDLDNHVLMVHSRGKGQVECPEKCGRKYWGMQGLKRHLACAHGQGKVTPPRPSHVCEQCGKVFRVRGHLDIHKQFHDGPETWKFSCSVCDKKIISQQKLDEHMRTHTKEKPFVCEICGTAYAHRHNLRIHVNSKHGMQDIPRKVNRVNMASSRKGKKLKPSSE